MKKLLILLCSTLLLACTQLKIKSEVYEIEVPENDPQLEKGNILLGGYSSLQFISDKEDSLIFLGITDRGPNGEEIKKSERPFLSPLYNPKIVEFTLNKNSKKVTAKIVSNLKNKLDIAINGLPPEGVYKTKKIEKAVNVNGQPLTNSSFGVDSEGLCKINDLYYVSEEYGPALLEFDSDFKLQQIWSPGQGIASEISERKTNRGFEGLACDNQFVYLMLQSPLPSEKNKIRFIQFSPKEQKEIQTFYYPIEESKADKIGDIAQISKNQFLVLEQNSKTDSQSIKNIYQINLDKTVNGLLEKKLLVDLTKLDLGKFEKLEGMTLINSHQIALINDNDFKQATTDSKDNLFNPTRKSYLIILSGFNF